MDAAALLLRLRREYPFGRAGVLQLQLRRARHCEVRIGDHTLFGPGVQILAPLHPLDAQLRREQEYGKAVEIASDVWVDGGVLILAGVRVGSRAIIGAGSVVTRNVPEGVFAAGNPCRVIRKVVEQRA